MSNYDQMIAFGRKLFLEWNQEEMIDRFHLRADDTWIYINFLGEPQRIHRESGRVENENTGQDAGFAATLSIFDCICRDNPLPGMCQRRCPVNSLRNAARSSPNTTGLHQPAADFFQEHIPALRMAISAYAPFPHGDAACIVPVFDWMDLVFQFWEGDEEFPPSVRFLWDENTPWYLRYESCYYVMGAFLDRIEARIAEIEKNVK